MNSNTSIIYNTSILYRFRFAIALFVLTLMIGTFGYMVLMDIGVVEALYFTVITLATVGYELPQAWTSEARLFTIFFILGGVATASYSLGVLISAMVESEIQDEFIRRRNIRKIKKYSGHTIICGLGRIGTYLAHSFADDSIPFIAIENDEAAFREGKEAGFMMLRGDATSDEVLLDAGIENARRFVPVLASDADNLYIIMSARQINPNLMIVARASNEAAVRKMERAGANKVVMCHMIGAQHMAQTILRPTVLDFIRLTGKRPDQEYMLEEIEVGHGSSLVDKTLTEIGMRRDIGVIIIGIKRADGDLVFNPSGATPIHAGDTLVALGDVERMDRLAKLTG